MLFFAALALSVATVRARRVYICCLFLPSFFQPLPAIYDTWTCSKDDSPNLACPMEEASRVRGRNVAVQMGRQRAGRIASGGWGERRIPGAHYVLIVSFHDIECLQYVACLSPPLFVRQFDTSQDEEHETAEALPQLRLERDDTHT